MDFMDLERERGITIQVKDQFSLEIQTQWDMVESALTMYLNNFGARLLELVEYTKSVLCLTSVDSCAGLLFLLFLVSGNIY